MPYPSDLTDEQRDLLEPVFNKPGKRGHDVEVAHGVCIATTLRHLSRERAHQLAVDLAA